MVSEKEDKSQIKEILLNLVSMGSTEELRSFLREHSELWTDSVLEEVDKLCSDQHELDTKFGLLWAKDLLESCRDIGVDEAVEEDYIKKTVRFLKEDPILSLVEEFIRHPENQLLDFIEEHKDILSCEVISYIGVLIVYAGLTGNQDQLKQYRKLLRRCKDVGVKEALAEYYGLTPVSGDIDSFMDMDELDELDKQLIIYEFSPTVAFLCCERLLITILTEGKAQSIQNEMQLVEMASRLHNSLHDQTVDLVYALLEDSNLQDQVVITRRLQHDFEEINLHDLETMINVCYPPPLSALQLERPIPKVAVFGSLYHILLNHLSRKKRREAEIFLDTTEQNLEIQDLPKKIPTVDLTKTEVDPDTGDTVLDISNLTIARSDGQLRLPLIVDYKIIGYYQMDSYRTLLVTDCANIGEIIYKYIMYVFDEQDVEPCLVVAAETNVQFQDKIQRFAPSGQSIQSPLFLGVFSSHGRSNLGLSKDLNDGNKFVAAAHEVVSKILGIPNEAALIDIKSQQERIEAILDKAYEAIRNKDYSSAIAVLIPLSESLRLSSYDDDYSRLLLHLSFCYFEMADFINARRTAAEGLNIAAARDKTENIGVFQFELAKIEYLEGNLVEALKLCREAIRIKLLSGGRWLRQGLALYTQSYNEDINGELYLLALVYKEQGHLKMAKNTLVQPRRNKSEGCDRLEGTRSRKRRKRACLIPVRPPCMSVPCS